MLQIHKHPAGHLPRPLQSTAAHGTLGRDVTRRGGETGLCQSSVTCVHRWNCVLLISLVCVAINKRVECMWLVDIMKCCRL